VATTLAMKSSSTPANPPSRIEWMVSTPYFCWSWTSGQDPQDRLPVMAVRSDQGEDAGPCAGARLEQIAGAPVAKAWAAVMVVEDSVTKRVTRPRHCRAGRPSWTAVVTGVIRPFSSSWPTQIRQYSGSCSSRLQQRLRKAVSSAVGSICSSPISRSNL